MLIGCISDTHIPRGPRRLPGACLERLRAVDLILHAGDVMTAEVLAEFESIGPPLVARVEAGEVSFELVDVG